MDGLNSCAAGGSLQISSGVIEKVARHAVMEVEGVHDVASSLSGQGAFLEKFTQAKPVSVELKNGVADITVALVAEYGTRIPELSEAVQQSVKEAVQSMTGIGVAKVDVVVTGLVEAAKNTP